LRSTLVRLVHSSTARQVVYCGISGNSRRMRWFACRVVALWKKWLARRRRGEGAFHWTRLNAILKRHPLPPARIVHRLYANASETLPVKNRMRETRTSGSVRGADGDIPTYSAARSRPQQFRDLPAAAAATLAGRFDEVGGRPFFVVRALGNAALRGSAPSEHAANPSLGHLQLGSNGVDAGAPRGAWKFPRAASARIISSSVRSDTARRSLAFSAS